MTTIRSAYINDQIDPAQRKTSYTNTSQQSYGNQSPNYANDPTHGPYNYTQGPNYSNYPQGYAPSYPYGNNAYYGAYPYYDQANHGNYPYGAPYYPNGASYYPYGNVPHPYYGASSYPYVPQGYPANVAYYAQNYGGYGAQQPYGSNYPYAQNYTAGAPHQGAYPYASGYGSQAYNAYPYGSYNPASYATSRPYYYEPHTKEEPLHMILKDLYRIYEDSHKGPQQGYSVPLYLDLREDETAYYVTAEIPGVAIKDYDLYYNEGTLTIRGEKKAYAYDRYEDKAYDADEKKYNTLATERLYGYFLRHVPLQGAIYADKIEARYINGILYVTLPKQGGDYTKGKKINIWTTGG